MARKLDLTPGQRRRFAALLKDTFDPTRFQYVLDAYAGKSLFFSGAMSGDDYEAYILEVVNDAEREWWTDLLLAGARAERPDNLDLYTFAEGLNLTPVAVAADVGGLNLERMVTRAGFLSMGPLLNALTMAERAVCRIEFPDERNGTGFLVAANMVLTNYHVIEQLHAGTDPAKVALRFGAMKSRDGSDEETGVVFRLDVAEPIAAFSPPSELDEQIGAEEAARGDDELDYALLRLDGAPGDAPIGESAGQVGVPRGWLGVAGGAGAAAVGDPLLIVQHPASGLMAVSTGEVVGFNEGKSRIRYSANTRRGSSGGPCFGKDASLVALHHAGDPDQDEPAVFNQGIPIAKVKESLETKGFGDVLTPAT